MCYFRKNRNIPFVFVFFFFVINIYQFRENFLLGCGERLCSCWEDTWKTFHFRLMVAHSRVHWMRFTQTGCSDGFKLHPHILAFWRDEAFGKSSVSHRILSLLWSHREAGTFDCWCVCNATHSAEFDRITIQWSQLRSLIGDFRN